MRLASYLAKGRSCFGAVTEAGLVTLSEGAGSRYASLREALAANAVPELRTMAKHAKPDLRPQDVQWLPPITNPEKILCAGINYRSHAAETGRELPKQPSM